MFCYYNTLAWEILAAAMASATVLATLPFVAPTVAATELPEKRFLISLIAVILVVGAGLFIRLRVFASRWISIEPEDDRTSPRAWIDYVERGGWKTRHSPRTRYTNIFLIAALGVALILFVLALFLF